MQQCNSVNAQDISYFSRKLQINLHLYILLYLSIQVMYIELSTIIYTWVDVFNVQ